MTVKASPQGTTSVATGAGTGPPPAPVAPAPAGTGRVPTPAGGPAFRQARRAASALLHPHVLACAAVALVAALWLRDWSPVLVVLVLAPAGAIRTSGAPAARLTAVVGAGLAGLVVVGGVLAFLPVGAASAPGWAAALLVGVLWIGRGALRAGQNGGESRRSSPGRKESMLLGGAGLLAGAAIALALSGASATEVPPASLSVTQPRTGTVALSFRVTGGPEAERYLVELRVDGDVIDTYAASVPAGREWHQVTGSLEPYRGRSVELRLSAAEHPSAVLRMVALTLDSP